MYLDNYCIVVSRVFLGFAERVLSVISIDNRALELLSEIGIDGMNDISVSAVGILS